MEPPPEKIGDFLIQGWGTSHEGRLRPGKSLGLSMPGIGGEFIKCLTKYSWLIVRLIILYGP